MWECETMHDLCNILRLQFNPADNSLLYACADALSHRPELFATLTLSENVRSELQSVAAHMHETWQRALDQAENGFTALGIDKESLPLRAETEVEAAHNKNLRSTVARLHAVVVWLNQQTPGPKNT